MLQHNAFCDRKTQTRAADFLRPGFVDAVKSLIYFVKGVLRNSDACIFHADVEVIGIRIDRDSHFSVIPVILDSVLDEIGDDHVHLDLIDLRIDVPDTDHRQFDIAFLRDRPDSVEHQLDHFVYIYFFDIELGILAVHPDQREELRDDLVLPVNFVFDIHHKLAVHGNRNIILLHKGVRQDFHRRHRRLQFM